jgi:ankyrin repeat protein
MSDVTRSLPPHPSLDQQKKRAKELIRAFRRGDPEARGRIRRHLPDKTAVKLADAQFVIAREYGFRSWADLKRHIEAHDVAPEAPPELAQAFRRAVQARDAAAVRSFFAQHPSAAGLVNAPIFDFDSPALVHLAGSGDVDLVDALLAAGADPNRRSDWWAGGFHPLYLAGDDVAERLLAAGAVADACAAAHLGRVDLLERLLSEDPSRVHERGGDGQTPLHFARTREVVDLLLDHGADIDARDVDHHATPAQWMLERAREAGRYAIARYLAERGATVDIFLGAALGLTRRVHEMLEDDPSLLDLRTGRGPYGEEPPASFHIYTWTLGQYLSPLQVAEHFGEREVLDLMLALANPKTRFLLACTAARAEDARSLLREHPKLMRELEAEDHRALADAAWTPDPSAVELMLDLGFDPAAAGQAGGTALHCAAWKGSAASVRAILRHPRAAEILELRDPSFESTPLGWCCHGAANSGQQDADYPGVARLLLEAGAEPVPGAEGLATAPPRSRRR